MEITVVAGDVTQLQVQALIVNLFEGVKQPGGATGAVDRALEGTISQLIADGEVKGKRGELTLLHTLGKVAPHRVLVAGLGKQEEFTQDTVRSVTGEACRRLRRLGLRQIATIAHGAGIAGLDTEAVGQAIAEGSLLGLYRFNRHITRDEEDQNELQELQIVEREKGKLPALQRGVERGCILAEATALARDMVNEPSNIMTPARMAEVAAEVAQGLPLELEVLERERMEELGMGALLGVSRGSAQPPKFIVLRYLGAPDNPSNSLGLVGKGITFDSGGISLKSASGMEEMKGDMAGGASVIGAMKALATLGPKLNVTGLVPAVENMPGGSAQRPGDIV
ncbi:MAG: M17 family metallopeptidase, partial [Dehalococcoidia bacterium]